MNELRRIDKTVPLERLSDTLRAFQQAHPRAYDIQGTFTSYMRGADDTQNLILLIITFRESPIVDVSQWQNATITALV